MGSGAIQIIHREQGGTDGLSQNQWPNFPWNQPQPFQLLDWSSKGREAFPAQALEGPMVRELQLVAVGLVFAFLGAIVIGVI